LALLQLPQRILLWRVVVVGEAEAVVAAAREDIEHLLEHQEVERLLKHNF
jgi:hypothetical protein